MMLVLSRKMHQSIRIGDDVIITVVKIQSGKVGISIDAPKAIPVHRGEIYKAIQAENQETTGEES